MLYKPSPELTALLSELLPEDHAEHHAVFSDPVVGVYHLGTPDAFTDDSVDSFHAIVEAARLHCVADHEGVLRLLQFATKKQKAVVARRTAELAAAEEKWRLLEQRGF